MRKLVLLNGRPVTYVLEYKNVRNVNLRIHPDGSIFVSANRGHPKKLITQFLQNNADKILATLDRQEELKKLADKIQKYDFDKEVDICREQVSVYVFQHFPDFEKYCGTQIPEMVFRRMKTRWGSCTPMHYSMSFNTRLAYVPKECVEYIVVHELCHFAHPNHSAEFYALLSSFIPDWRQRREEIRKYEGLMI